MEVKRAVGGGQDRSGRRPLRGLSLVQAPTLLQPLLQGAVMQLQRSLRVGAAPRTTRHVATQLA